MINLYCIFLVQVFGQTDQYSFMVSHQISAMDFWERPLLDPLMKAFPLAMQTLRITNGKSSFPVQVEFNNVIDDIHLIFVSVRFADIFAIFGNSFSAVKRLDYLTYTISSTIT